MDNATIKIQPVILAGGLGMRLWPLSKTTQPKQFGIFDDGLSLFQHTLIRNAIFGTPIVIINQLHTKIALAQIAETTIKTQIIIEPEIKGSAICSILAAIITKENASDCTLLLPSDHLIRNTKAYIQTIKQAAEFSNNTNIVTIGIKPTCANTNYGYIKLDHKQDQGVHYCDKFIEKPDQESANNYFLDNNFLWNSGIFLYKPDKFFDFAKRLQPEMLECATKIWQSKKVKLNTTYLDSKLYQNLIKSDTIDYAFIEKLQNIAVITGHFYWSDLGNYNSLFEMMQKDQRNNHMSKNSFTCDKVVNSLIMHDKKIAIILGLPNVVIVSNNDYLLVAAKDKIDDIKTYLQTLNHNSL